MEDNDMKKRYEAPTIQFVDTFPADFLALYISNLKGKFSGGSIGDGTDDDFFADPSANSGDWDHDSWFDD